MKEPKKRWGKKRTYKRDWPSYNEELVRRGTFYLDFDWVKGWNKEIEEMNENKVGAPYQFPESLIQLQAVWHQLVVFRDIEGITRAVVEAGQLPEFNDFSTINRRVNKTNTTIKLPEKGDINVSTDGTGTKLNMSGEYYEAKYGDGKKKFIKVVISADPITKNLLKVDASLEGEELSEPHVAMNHMAELEAEGFHILKFWGDGSFDIHELFDFLDYYNIESAIKINKDAIIDPKGSVRRNIEVAKFKEHGYDAWADEVEYGIRWLGTEGIISAVKRKFGERVRAKKEENMIKEAKQKFWAYEKIKVYARA
jgi:hypothetical protein